MRPVKDCINPFDDLREKFKLHPLNHGAELLHLFLCPLHDFPRGHRLLYRVQHQEEVCCIGSLDAVFQLLDFRLQVLQMNAYLEKGLDLVPVRCDCISARNQVDALHGRVRVRLNRGLDAQLHRRQVVLLQKLKPFAVSFREPSGAFPVSRPARDQKAPGRAGELMEAAHVKPFVFLAVLRPIHRHKGKMELVNPPLFRASVRHNEPINFMAFVVR